MVGAEKMAEKVPSWVERLLVPTLESRVRTVVKEEVGHLEKIMNAKFDAVNTRVGSVEKRINDRFDGLTTKIDSLEERIPVIRDIADLKARLAAVESRASR